MDAAGGNYRLQSNSPCINTGTNQDWMVGAFDLAGNARIFDGRVDMGAYESQVVTTNPALTVHCDATVVSSTTETARLYGMSANVMGMITLTNTALPGAVSNLAVTSEWDAMMALQPGVNTFYVSATNEYGAGAAANIAVTRDGTPELSMDRLSATNVPYATSNLMISGTANGYVATVTWTNTLSHESGHIAGAANWSVAVPLLVGSNEIAVSGVNAAGETATVPAQTVVRDDQDPILSVTPEDLSARARCGRSTTQTVSFTVSNTGGKTLNYTVTAENINWFDTLNPTNGALSQSEQEVHTLTLAPATNMVSGTYTGRVSVVASGVTGSPVDIDVVLELYEGGALGWLLLLQSL